MKIATPFPHGYLAPARFSAYTKGRMLKIPVAVVILAALASCGPREIGEGSSPEAALTPEATGADLLRLPMTGMDNNQKMLYWQNRPDVMASLQKFRMEQYRRRMGFAPAPEDPAYREFPKQRSPFRQ